MSEHKRRERTIFWMALRSLLVVLAVEMLLMVGSLVAGGVIQTLNSNSRDILAKQVENRGSYLTGSMALSWSNLSGIADKINDCTQEYLAAEGMTPEDLGREGGGDPLINRICHDLIDTMYNKQVSGIFVLISTQPDAAEKMPGIYLRDLDPTSMPSELHADILVERAPVSVVRAGYLATDTGWQPVFSAA